MEKLEGTVITRSTLQDNSKVYIKRLMDEDPRKLTADVVNETLKMCAINVFIIKIKHFLNKTD